jgi:diaminopimelate epimerase
VTARSGLPFLKGHGTANDFVLLPDPDGTLDLTPDMVAALCDRRRGIGGDGVLRVVPTAAVDSMSTTDAPWFMDYRNADGSVAEMCGNGIRVFARYLVSSGAISPGTHRIATRDGIKTVEVPDEGDVTVDMGVVSVRSDVRAGVRVRKQRFTGIAVDAGNPHIVVGVPDPDAVGLDSTPELTPESAFPDGANVEFVASTGHAEVRMRVYERGVGETFSCGTGACAVVAAARHLAPASPTSYAVELRGGRLVVTALDDGRMLLTGPAVIVASGEIDHTWLDAVSAERELAETRS